MNEDICYALDEINNRLKRQNELLAEISEKLGGIAKYRIVFQEEPVKIQ